MTQPTDDLTAALDEAAYCIVIGRKWCAGGRPDRRHPECVIHALRSLRDSEPERFAALMGLERWGGWVTTDRCNHGDRDGCHLPHDYEPLYRIKGTP